MGYHKEISATITIYPDFYKCVYFDYLKNKINEWIGECFNTYNDSFLINVANPSGIAQFYTYQIGQGEINYHKMWKNPHGSYNIHIEASGEVMNGLSDSIIPPKELMEHSLNYINLKYIENSKKDGIKLIAFGRENGVPVEYNSITPDIEGWRKGIYPNIDCICHDFHLSFNVSKEIYDTMFNLFQQLVEISEDANLLHFDMDESTGYVGIEGIYKLPESQKSYFFDTLKEIALILIQDDLFEVDEIKMYFSSVDKNTYYIEVYEFNDMLGIFYKRSLLL